MDQLEQLGESWTEGVEFGIFRVLFSSIAVYVEDDSSGFCQLGSVDSSINLGCEGDFLSSHSKGISKWQEDAGAST